MRNLKNLENRINFSANFCPILVQKNEIFANNYSKNHLFNIPTSDPFSEHIGNMVTNLAVRLQNMGKYLSPAELDELIANKLSAGKENYTENRLLEVLSEIETLSYFTRFFKLIYFQYEPRLNTGKKNPEVRFKINESFYEIEVKCPNFNKAKELSKDDVVINFRSEEALELKNKYNCILPVDNKIKDYLESSQSKFSIDCASKDISCYGILFINWQDFRFYDIESIFYNTHSGIFTEKSFIRDSKDNQKTFDRVNGVVFYKGAGYSFVDLRMAEKIFIQNPYSKQITMEFLNKIINPIKICKPKFNYQLYYKI